METSWRDDLDELISNLKFVKQPVLENIKLLMVHENAFFEVAKTINFSRAQTVEEAYRDIIFLSTHFFISNFLQKKIDSKYSNRCDETRNKILKIFKIQNELNNISSDINDWYCVEINQPYDEAENNFSRLMKGENPKQMEKSLLAFIILFSQSMPDNLQFSNSIMNFFKMLCLASSEKELSDITNNTVLIYWQNYIEFNKDYNSSMFECKESVIREINKIEDKFSRSLTVHNLRIIHIDDLLEIYSLYLLFETDKESLIKAETEYRLLERIFNHKYQIMEYNGKQVPCPDFQIFIKSAAPFIENFQNYYGIAICCFLLLQYIPYDKFCLIFLDPKSSDQNQFDVAKIFGIKNYLETYRERAKSIDPHNLDLIKRYAGYEEELLEALNNCPKDIYDMNVIENNIRCGSYKLLQSMMFFAVWKICGSYNVDEYSISNRDEGIEKKFKIEKPFNDSVKDGSWYGTKKQKQIYNHVASEFGFNIDKLSPAVSCFDEIDYEDLSNRDSVMNLLYNLTRSRIYSKEALMNQMNYTRSQQCRLLYIRWSKNGGYEDFYKASEIKKQLENIDIGFKIQNYEQNVYPFNLPSFKGNLRNRLKLVREISCKFCCETDNIIDIKKNKIDWRATNKIGFFTRYLYKDRNIETHKGRHTTVESLLKPSYWQNLLFALLDFQTEVLHKKLIEENAHHNYIDNSPRQDPVFFMIDTLCDIQTMLITINTRIKSGLLKKRFLI